MPVKALKRSARSYKPSESHLSGLRQYLPYLPRDKSTTTLALREDELIVCVFFFSSRRRHTRSLCDWSSDVCSSDLVLGALGRLGHGNVRSVRQGKHFVLDVEGTPDRAELEQIAETLLANPVIEDVELHLQIGRASCRERV